jgi:plasmid maintenance system antidote protein VapI
MDRKRRSHKGTSVADLLAWCLESCDIEAGDLAKATGVPLKDVFRVLRGKQPVFPADQAIALGKAFDIEPGLLDGRTAPPVQLWRMSFKEAFEAIARKAEPGRRRGRNDDDGRIREAVLGILGDKMPIIYPHVLVEACETILGEASLLHCWANREITATNLIQALAIVVFNMRRHERRLERQLKELKQKSQTSLDYHDLSGVGMTVTSVPADAPKRAAVRARTPAAVSAPAKGSAAGTGRKPVAARSPGPTIPRRTRREAGRR